MILFRRRIPRVVSAGLVLTSGCYETVVFDGPGGASGGGVDAGALDLATPDMGAALDAFVDGGAADSGAGRLAELLPLFCEAYTSCGYAGASYDECVATLTEYAEYFRETYGAECYATFLELQACVSEVLVSEDCDPTRVIRECGSEYAAYEAACP